MMVACKSITGIIKIIFGGYRGSDLSKICPSQSNMADSSDYSKLKNPNIVYFVILGLYFFIAERQGLPLVIP